MVEGFSLGKGLCTAGGYLSKFTVQDLGTCSRIQLNASVSLFIRSSQSILHKTWLDKKSAEMKKNIFYSLWSTRKLSVECHIPLGASGVYFEKGQHHIHYHYFFLLFYLSLGYVSDVPMMYSRACIFTAVMLTLGFMFYLV